MRTASHVIVESLTAHGVDRLFVVPGESHLGLLDALYDSAIQVVVCRHEAGAGFMAVADSRLTGRPSAVLVSRGPGASNAAIAVHTAQQDAVPLILLVGQVPRQDLRRGAFQEIDYGRMYGGVAKWTAEVTDAERIGEVMQRALQIATAGVPGPVVLALPEDLLTARSAALAAQPQKPSSAAPDPAAIAQLSEWIERAERPLIVAGGEFDRPGGRETLLRLATARQIPVAVSFRRHDVFATDHRLYGGHLDLSIPPAQLAAFRDSDLVLALGTRMGDITSQGYQFPQIGRPEMRFVHAHGDGSVLGVHFATDLALACAAPLVADALGKTKTARNRDSWIQRLAGLRPGRSAVPASQGIPFEDIVIAADRSLPDDAIVTVDAGTFGAPVYRVMRFGGRRRLLAPISGAMGFGVPAAVAAALREPGRAVCCMVGDGDLLMTGAELAVALEHKLPLKVIVSENHCYGSILLKQQRDYGDRNAGTRFVNPDLMKLGEAYGMATAHLRAPGDVARLGAILTAPGPAFVVVDTPPPDATSDAAAGPMRSREFGLAEAD